MGKSNYSVEFKRDAVHPITVRGSSVRQVSQRLGVSAHSLYEWMKRFVEPAHKTQGVDHEVEKRRLKRELARVTEERDILKKMDLSRFRAAPVAHLSDFSFEGQGAFPAQCRVPSTRIVEAVDVFEDGHLSIATCPPGSLPQQFRLDGLEEGFNGSVVVTIPGPAH